MADADPKGEQVSLTSFSESTWARSVRRARKEELGAVGESVADLEIAVDGEPVFTDTEWRELSPEKKGDVLCARLQRIEKRVAADDADEPDAARGPQPRGYY